MVAMDVPQLGGLVLLALVDSTSFGTLVIPVWLLMAPGRLRPGRLLVYLGTVATFYLAVGLAVTAGAGVAVDRLGGALDSRPAALAQLLLGVALVALSYRIDPGRTTDAAGPERGRPGRVARWRERVMGVSAEGDHATVTTMEPGTGVSGTGVSGTGATAAGTGALIVLAVAAAAVEVATMLPYLAAIGIITTSGPGWPGNAALLAGYCLVMIAPALVLLNGRVLARRAVEPVLARLNAWLTAHAASATAWTVGVVGVLLALDAVGRLGWTGG